jgi:hypothetical protein
MARVGLQNANYAQVRKNTPVFGLSEARPAAGCSSGLPITNPFTALIVYGTTFGSALGIYLNLRFAVSRLQFSAKLSPGTGGPVRNIRGGPVVTRMPPAKRFRTLAVSKSEFSTRQPDIWVFVATSLI